MARPQERRSRPELTTRSRTSPREGRPERQGPEEILARRNSELTAKLRTANLLGVGESAEEQRRGGSGPSPGKCTRKRRRRRFERREDGEGEGIPSGPTDRGSTTEEWGRRLCSGRRRTRPPVGGSGDRHHPSPHSQGCRVDWPAVPSRPQQRGVRRRTLRALPGPPDPRRQGRERTTIQCLLGFGALSTASAPTGPG